ncbi:argininosuccinate synthase [Ignisphaera aggregans DSM 17230]|uniref:Argininosuccinate synthase n=1 Tax=Ignisphaera aggregans (strain DSM 17230 / JCM 13409 / AQ1.S1) TaxID=583356 RepID=E0SS83_IGNAA|nr:argininosuccinate synthase [Ignisphaera aggregans DSM 17230]
MRVVLAYSGGLDTSTILVLLRKKYNAEVITVTVDVGQEDELRDVEKRAYELGAIKHYTIDAKKEFVEEYIFRAIKANALYEGKYPLGTALARPLIAKKVAEIAKKEGADAVAHGCTGKGNDQVRFDITLKAFLDPEIKIIAPVRELRLTRSENIKILSEYGYKVSEIHKKYSIDENLWSRSIEGGEIDDPMAEPPEDAFSWTISPEKTPDKPLYIEIEFDKGVPVKIDGEKMDSVELIKFLNRVIGSYGYGRIDLIESRVIGLKSREVYEAPAALALIEAHSDLERMVLTPKELRFKRMVDEMWSDLVYQGLWIDPMRIHLENVIDSMNRYVSGISRLKIYKGSLYIVGRNSPYSLYSREIIDYNKGWYPSDAEARGFITIHSLYALMAKKVRGV